MTEEKRDIQEVSVRCPECGRAVGAAAGVSIYKHALSCFGLEHKGIANLLRDADLKTTERNFRIAELLAYAEREGEDY